MKPPTPPLRVAFVLHLMQVAGAEMLVAQIIRRLRGAIEPTVLCLDGIGPLGEQLLSEGVPVVHLHRKPGRDTGLPWRLANELSRRRVQVVHAHQYTPFFYAALARMLTWSRPRLLFTEHGRHFPDLVSPMRRRVNHLFLRHLASEINACCRFSADALAQIDGFAPTPINVLENGIELPPLPIINSTNVHSLKFTLGLDPARRFLACVARFHPVKDHAMLLRAFARLAPRFPDVDLLLAGDGPLRADLHQQVAASGLDHRVRFLGVRSDVPALLQAVDAFALTSVSEAASLTVLEAMAAGLPVVVTAVGGNPEMVRHEIEGLLVPRGDDQGCADALTRLLEAPAFARRLGDAGRARVEAHYQLSRTIQRYHALYQRLSGLPASATAQEVS